MRTGRTNVDYSALGNKLSTTTRKAQEEIASHLFRIEVADLRKRIIALEEEKASLQYLVCHLLIKNEDLRATLYQR
jgi:hypothetical protein